MLGLLKTKHVLNTMFILKYSLADLNSERNLEEQLKNEKNPCNDLDGASRELTERDWNSGNKR